MLFELIYCVWYAKSFYFFFCNSIVCVTRMIKDNSGSLNIIAVEEDVENFICINAYHLYLSKQEVFFIFYLKYDSKV